MKERKPKGRVSRALHGLAGGRGASADSLVHEWQVLPTVAVSCYWIWLYLAYSLDVFVVSSDAFVRFDILQKGFGFLGAALFMVAVSLLRTAAGRCAGHAAFMGGSRVVLRHAVGVFFKSFVQNRWDAPPSV